MKFSLLGPLEADTGGDPLDVGPPKQRLILAALLLARGRVVSLNQLLEAAWGDNPPPSAVGTLQAYVSRVRGVLRLSTASESVTLVRQSPGYRLDGAVMDVDDFEHLSDLASSLARSGQWEGALEAATMALSLWRGPLLADLPDDPWVLRERRRVEERMERCVEVLVTALLGQRRHAEALEQARRLVDLQPLRDQAVWLYMLALHRCGRSAEALDVYRDYAKALDEELGLEPVQELRDLQTAILREDVALAVWPDPEPVAVAEATAARRTPSAAPEIPLVGRAETMARLERWCEEVDAGTPRWLLLTGPSGIGKTRLAEELVRRLPPPGRVAWTGCLQDDGVPSWWPLRALVRQLGGNADETFHVAAQADPDAARFGVYARMADLLHNAAARGPVLVVVDDIQWLDPASALTVAHLVQTVRDVPVGVVLTLRDGPRTTAIDAVLAAFARHPGATHLEVGALDDAGTAELLGELAGTPPSAAETRFVSQQTGGNPLLLTEYARLPAAERAAGVVPLAVREVLGRRFARFDRDALRILQTAAVAGDGFEPVLLAAATGSSIPQVVDVLDAAADEAIIAPGHERPGYRFGHGLLREHLIGELSPVRLQATHAAVAAAIALRDGPDEDILRRAQHLSAAMPVARSTTVIAACRDAAEYAESVWDWAAAARQWAAARGALGARRAGDRRELHDELLAAEVAALARAGRGETLLGVVTEALQDVGSLRRGRVAARLAGSLLRSRGAWPWVTYGPATIHDRLVTAVEVTRADAAAQVPLLSALAVGHCYAPDLRIPDDLSRQALDLAEALGDPDALADALLGRALVLAGVPSHGEEVAQALDRLAELSHRHASTDAVLRDILMTTVMLGRGDLAAVEEYRRVATAGSDVLRLPVARAQLHWVEATLAHWHGDLDRAERLAALAHERHAQTELYGAEDAYATAHLAILWDRGALGGAGAEIRRSPDPLTWSAAAAAEADDRGRGAQLVDAVLRPEVDGEPLAGRRLLATDPAGGRWHYWHTLGNLCVVAHAVADLALADAAPRVLELLAPHAGHVATIGQTAPIGPVSLPAGRLHALLGNTDAARTAYAAAAEVALRTGASLTMVRIRAAQAELARPGAERDRRLSAVAEHADHVGLAALARRLRRMIG
jgi:DNA-binding SARP family transcriptional activator